ncbi:MAG: hypothetical protein HY542_05675 [Deltaproteobacteria bacterium]|nr:hypothetical protein [Deltaproteobacteria bacterium]
MVRKILHEGVEIEAGGELPQDQDRFYNTGKIWDRLSGRRWSTEQEAVYSLGRGLCTLVLVNGAAYGDADLEDSDQVAGAVIFCKNNGSFAEPTIIRPNISNIPHAVRLFQEGRGRRVGSF